MSTTIQKIYPVLNMHCAGCANNVERTVKKLPGVTDASVNFASNQLNVSFEGNHITPGEIRAAVLAAGYDLIIEETRKAERQEEAQHLRYQRLKHKVTGAWILVVPLLFFAMVLRQMPYTEWIQMMLAIPMLAFFGNDFFVGAWKQLKLGRSNMDTLVALSTSIAFLFSLFNTLFPEYWRSHGLETHVYYEASGVIIAFVLTGKLMEERAKGNTSAAIRRLMGLQPKTARVRRTNGQEEEMPIEELQVGNLIIVHPGEQLPVDGQVAEGESYVDESMISGEPIPVGKVKGDKVLAGTVNQRGSFVVSATQVGSETVLARIIRLVQEAQGSKAPVQRIVDRVTEFFVPTVLGIAILTFVLWLAIGGTERLSYGVLSAVSVLVIACPCALGLATPTALMVGMGKAADLHILIKDALALEQMRKVNVIVFDKTGTLTEGTPAVKGWLWAQPQEAHHKEVLLAAELKSEHPLANAIVEALRQGEPIQPATLDRFESLTGKGVKVGFQGTTYWVGSHKLLNDFNVPIDEQLSTMLKEYATEGNSIIYFGQANELLAAIAVSDPIKATSPDAIKQLKAQGTEVYMLTGDSERTAKAVATSLGIDQYVADALPDDKAEYIRELQLQGKRVAMVGDGINDSQALALADVSVAMGKGTDIAMDVAMVTLMTSDLLLLPKAFQLSRQTVRLIHQNLFWAFIYNVIGIPIAAGVLFPFDGLLLSPMLASAAMAFSSVSVVLNSLSLGRRRI
ncbi:MAG: heavy metal translocating P-type ATPase [Mediterranea sp.]|jgi:Cu2+-exporting ATPase|nr:heavy metal translocating P-type ATPase [Mediterranea sp.]